MKSMGAMMLWKNGVWCKENLPEGYQKAVTI
jgi:hypothetical protein